MVPDASTCSILLAVCKFKSPELVYKLFQEFIRCEYPLNRFVYSSVLATMARDETKTLNEIESFYEKMKLDVGVDDLSESNCHRILLILF